MVMNFGSSVLRTSKEGNKIFRYVVTVKPVWIFLRIICITRGRGKTAVRFIEDLRNKYKGEEIWVMGTGPSLDDFPDNFFDNKISIACNWAFVAFQNCTYFLNYHIAHSDFIRKYLSHLTHKWLLWFPPEDKLNHEWVDKQRDMILVQRDVTGVVEENFDKAVDAIMRGKPYKYLASGTMVHGAIQVAAVLGAAKITLVGCEHRARPDQGHAGKRGMRIFYQESPPGLQSYSTALNEVMLLGTNRLVEAFKRHGIEVMRYYFDKGYEKIV